MSANIKLFILLIAATVGMIYKPLMTSYLVILFVMWAVVAINDHED